MSEGMTFRIINEGEVPLSISYRTTLTLTGDVVTDCLSPGEEAFFEDVEEVLSLGPDDEDDDEDDEEDDDDEDGDADDAGDADDVGSDDSFSDED